MSNSGEFLVKSGKYSNLTHSDELHLFWHALRYFILSFAFFGPIPAFSAPPFTGDRMEMPCYQGDKQPNGRTSQGAVCAPGIPSCKQAIDTLESKMDMMYEDWEKAAYQYKVHLDFEKASDYFNNVVPRPQAPGFPLPGTMCDASDGEENKNRLNQRCGENFIHIAYEGATMGLVTEASGKRKKVGDIEQSWLNGFFKNLLKEEVACAKEEIKNEKSLRLVHGMDNLAKQLKKLYVKMEKETTRSSRVYLEVLKENPNTPRGLQSMCQQQNLLENSDDIVGKYCSKNRNVASQSNAKSAAKAVKHMQSTCYLATASQQIIQATARLLFARARIMADYTYQKLTLGDRSPFDLKVKQYVDSFRSRDIKRAVRSNLRYCLGVPCGYNEGGMKRDAAANMSTSYRAGFFQVMKNFYNEHLGKPCR